ncbi:hypothetical protein EVAR_53386_1 [Eumeta japonica]|uniref:Uncharacterized protein n=1 Tax=Eumeta variegata TaxID=151549 RepID=A0A4C1Y5C9_EUMVA|nr:hypothetical protein EVAR_53386_1 [Eumeta japonica]
MDPELTSITGLWSGAELTVKTANIKNEGIHLMHARVAPRTSTDNGKEIENGTGNRIRVRSEIENQTGVKIQRKIRIRIKRLIEIEIQKECLVEEPALAGRRGRDPHTSSRAHVHPENCESVNSMSEAHLLILAQAAGSGNGPAPRSRSKSWRVLSQLHRRHYEAIAMSAGAIRKINRFTFMEASRAG